MKNDYYFRQVLHGAVMGMCALTLFYLVSGVVDAEKRPSTPQSNFAVVDKYEGCDVVQWENGTLGRYQYFLHCDNK